MKYSVLILAFILSTNISIAQINQQNTSSDFLYSDCTNCKSNLFISSNSGIINTPYGLRVGYINKVGFYLGGRYGHGELIDYTGREIEVLEVTDLYSITGGFISPFIARGELNIRAFMGVGYGDWFPVYREGWIKSGCEIEAGLILTHNRLLLSIGVNMLDANNRYSTWDMTLGIGFRF